MTSTIPTTMKAVIEDQAASWVTIKDVPVPEPGENEVLIKVEYAAQNPSDWKLAAYMSVDGMTQGCDYSGTIVKLGSNLKVDLQVGDKIAGTITGGTVKGRGSYAEYMVAETDLTFKVPEGTDMAGASTFGVAWGTAAQIFFQSQTHSLTPLKPVEGSPWYTLYSGATSVGLFAIQIAKLLGYKVLTFASPHSFELVKSYGADEVINYKDADAVEQALKITNGGTELGFDTISEGGSFKIALGALGPKGKVLNVINPIPEEAKAIRPEIPLFHTIFYTTLGKELNFSPRTPDQPTIIPLIPENAAFGKEYHARTSELIAKHRIRANPVDLRQGLEAISQGLKDQMEGKVSGKKIVYKIA
ncbi:uncharacterized protein I303_104041 [Kwoniella dejecticola CBS 10117]|uniref:Enoyl reductase (ER) domain-containing protein n=1 Tax=Kwoniella dejecticola CBS 10117 TaxID=1296121 RepID=A0A1A6A8F5_9TREE|nr:uncharacterized protein I303_04060 [Kwoniella dejecticola CBS 10117]OBR86336.1 hypothetical protein I303_04060 [Kwoniella dejecticola CBS 10117]